MERNVIWKEFYVAWGSGAGDRLLRRIILRLLKSDAQSQGIGRSTSIFQRGKAPTKMYIDHPTNMHQFLMAERSETTIVHA